MVLVSQVLGSGKAKTTQHNTTLRYTLIAKCVVGLCDS